MHIEVRYLSKSGNTKKLADAIARALGVEAKSITQAVPPNTDILFLGGAVYWGGVDKELKKFITTLEGRALKVAVFSTAAIAPSAHPQMKKLINQQHVTVIEREFHCRGEFMKIHNGHPDSEDLNLAKQFAQNVVKEYR